MIEGPEEQQHRAGYRNHNLAATLFYRWKEDVEQAAVAALGEETLRRGLTKSTVSESELERSLGKAHVQINRY